MKLTAEQISVRADRRSLLQDVDVEVAAGELVCVVGPNGAGKSTLLAALAGDRRVDAGSVRLGAAPVQTMTAAQQALLRAVVAAPPPLAFDFTVAEVVAMGWVQGAHHGPGAQDRALSQVLARCGLSALAERVFMTLSSGEQQRAQFARGLLQLWRPQPQAQPRWLLLDEPTANLDIAHAIDLLNALREARSEGMGVLAIVHDLDLAARFADRVVVLDQGRVAASGAPAQVLTADLLSRVYGTPVHVEYHSGLGRLAVLA